MKIILFVARHRHHYGIGLSAAAAEENMLNEFKRMPDVYTDAEVTFPNLKDRGDCIDFAAESVDIHEKREAFLKEFHESGKVAECPEGITHVSVDEMGGLSWRGGTAGAMPKYLTYASDRSPGWQ